MVKHNKNKKTLKEMTKMSSKLTEKMEKKPLTLYWIIFKSAVPF